MPLFFHFFVVKVWFPPLACHFELPDPNGGGTKPVTSPLSRCPHRRVLDQIVTVVGRGYLPGFGEHLPHLARYSLPPTPEYSSVVYGWELKRLFPRSPFATHPDIQFVRLPKRKFCA